MRRASRNERTLESRRKMQSRDRRDVSLFRYRALTLPFLPEIVKFNLKRKPELPPA